MNKLLVILGPTGVGKTELSLRLAQHYGCDIVNADSRQIYHAIPIGTAAPTLEDRMRVKHHFVGIKDLHESYNAGQYERDCVELLNKISLQHTRLQTPFAILTGGSMMYIDAVCQGLDDIPTIPDSIRNELNAEYDEKGLMWLQNEVERIDPLYWQIVDQNNPQRLKHALEIYRLTQCPYSSFRKKSFDNSSTIRPWDIVYIGLHRDRESLYERINLRVDVMVKDGLLEEANNAFHAVLRDSEWKDQTLPNSLNTVGYKELFAYFVGNCTLEEAIEKIKQNSRHYAKRQMTWFNRNKNINWINASDSYEEQMDAIHTYLVGTR